MHAFQLEKCSRILRIARAWSSIQRAVKRVTFKSVSFKVIERMDIQHNAVTIKFMLETLHIHKDSSHPVFTRTRCDIFASSLNISRDGHQKFTTRLKFSWWAKLVIIRNLHQFSSVHFPSHSGTVAAVPVFCISIVVFITAFTAIEAVHMQQIVSAKKTKFGMTSYDSAQKLNYLVWSVLLKVI